MKIFNREKGVESQIKLRVEGNDWNEKRQTWRRPDMRFVFSNINEADPQSEQRLWEESIKEAKVVSIWMMQKFGNMKSNDPRNLAMRLNIAPMSEVREEMIDGKENHTTIITTGVGLGLEPRNFDGSGDDTDDGDLLIAGRQLVAEYIKFKNAGIEQSLRDIKITK